MPQLSASLATVHTTACAPSPVQRASTQASPEAQSSSTAQPLAGDSSCTQLELSAAKRRRSDARRIRKRYHAGPKAPF